jgi:enoyl-[acyl-carrier protein] reductase II
MNNKITKMLGTKYPLIQGGMANIATGAFAAAVSNAGALGLIATGGMDAAGLKKNIDECRSLTDKPFGVNIMLMNPDAAQIAQLLIDEQIPVVTTGAGNPAKFIPAWKAAGIRVIPVVPSVALAVRLERAGADALIVEGTEAGGHIGELTTMALVPQVVDAVSIPVIAAGGIADGRQLLAAFALGACGVQVGTCLLTSEECPIHENYKQAILDARDTDTTVTGRIAGVPVRIIKNKMAREYVKREKEGAEKMELEKFTLGSLRRAVFDGDIEYGSVMAGQVAGMCNCVRPLAEIIEDMFAGCASVYQNLPGNTGALDQIRGEILLK